MARTKSIKEWIGKNDDSKAPPKVYLRIRDKQKGKCAHCCRTLRDTEAGELDHIEALINGGENRESNLQLLCKPCHLLKTKVDVATKVVAARKQTHLLGLKKKNKTPKGKLRKHLDGRVSRWNGQDWEPYR